MSERETRDKKIFLHSLSPPPPPPPPSSVHVVVSYIILHTGRGYDDGVVCVSVCVCHSVRHIVTNLSLSLSLSLSPSVFAFANERAVYSFER